MQIARGLSRFACPICAGITDFAERQIQKPTTSPEAKEVWAAVGVTALIVGLVIFADRASQWA